MKKQETFIVEILGTENQSWQGEIIWAGEKRKQYFRSALEMLRMMDSVISTDADDTNENAFSDAETV